MTKSRRNTFTETRSAGLAIAATALISSACGGDSTTPFAEVAPDVAAVCSEANSGLLSLVGVEPGERTLDDAEDFLFDIVIGMPSIDTDIGRPGGIVGDEVQAVRRALREVQDSYDIAGQPFDPVDVEERIVAAFPLINAGASEFGLEQCVDPVVLDEVLIPQLAAAIGERAAIEPTGDFGVDIVAVCERFRSNETELRIDNLTDPNAEFLIFSRLRGLVGELAADIDRLTVPVDRQDAVTAALATIDEYDDAVDAVESGRLVSQDALDSATAKFTDVEGTLNTRLAALDPEC